MEVTLATPKQLERIRALLARAAHATTPEEEARTSAVQAARLIARHKVEIGAPVLEVRVWTGSSSVADPQAWATAVGDFGQPYAAKVGGRCQLCKRGYRRGERIKWRNPIGPVHVEC